MATMILPAISIPEPTMDDGNTQIHIGLDVVPVLDEAGQPTGTTVCRRTLSVIHRHIDTGKTFSYACDLKDLPNKALADEILTAIGDTLAFTTKFMGWGSEQDKADAAATTPSLKAVVKEG